jgi:hypothetical protein
MFISVVEIDLPPDIDLDSLKDGFNVTAPRYAHVPGLLRKYYCNGAEDQVTGGVFVWDSLEAAKAGHADPEWRRLIKDKYGEEPRVTYFEVPVVVDNGMQRILRGPDYLDAIGACRVNRD